VPVVGVPAEGLRREHERRVERVGERGEVGVDGAPRVAVVVVHAGEERRRGVVAAMRRLGVGEPARRRAQRQRRRGVLRAAERHVVGVGGDPLARLALEREPPRAGDAAREHGDEVQRPAAPRERRRGRAGAERHVVEVRRDEERGRHRRA
jgi:hypothetical protein